jgi:diaminopimelate epimerase
MNPEFSFIKYHGTGNDFILIDHRQDQLGHLSRATISKICDRRFGIGGDGLILLQSHPEFDFEMKNFNSDGGECSMCGNGARTLIQFARDLGYQQNHFRFLASDGAHEAKLEGDLIAIKMKDVLTVTTTPLGPLMDTGSPHLVIKKDGLMTFHVTPAGREIRNSALFMPGGVNVNFVEAYDDHLFVRTYERGVEDETLSCGTGVIAAALANSKADGAQSSRIQTRGGILEVRFDRKSKTHFENIWLVGPAIATFKGNWLESSAL